MRLRILPCSISHLGPSFLPPRFEIPCVVQRHIRSVIPRAKLLTAALVLLHPPVVLGVDSADLWNSLHAPETMNIASFVVIHFECSRMKTVFTRNLIDERYG
jgi:hypothetical protein